MRGLRIFTILIALLGAFTARAAEESLHLMLDPGGHLASVTGLAFTPDGQQIISAGHDKVIRVWDWRGSRTIRTIRGQVGPGDEGMIYAIALSPDGRWLAVGGFLAQADDPDKEAVGSVRLYDFATGELRKIL